MSRLGRESGLRALLVWNPSSFLSVNFILTAGCAGCGPGAGSCMSSLELSSWPSVLVLGDK